MKRVYVAGPYKGNSAIAVLRNMQRGIRAAEWLFSAGYAPFAPWFDYHFELIADHERERYLQYSLAWLEVSDAVVVLDGWRNSQGTLREIKRAQEKGIPVYYGVAAFLEAVGNE